MGIDQQRAGGTEVFRGAFPVSPRLSQPGAERGGQRSFLGAIRLVGMDQEMIGAIKEVVMTLIG
ncbi:MAG: hypothetical protein JZU65_15560 [Chlorobium sp.]|nr:hypothetical protein [Chlorobium sp.]